MSGRVWTIYNHGTGASSLKKASQGEIVNLFGNRDPTQQMHGKIITEGVGSIGDPTQLATSFSRDAQSGKYTIGRQRGPALNGLSRGVKQGTGDGVQINVDSTVEIIRALNLAGRCPERINMLGWSRGAVTCIRVAHALGTSQDPVLRNIPIHIFAVDPVAGAGHNKEEDAINLTPNVRAYAATLAAGERRNWFKPIAGQRLQSVNSTQRLALPMPGNHTNTAKCDNPVGQIVFDMAYRFLNKFGSNVTQMDYFRLSSRQAWDKYEECLLGTAKGVKTTAKASQIMFGGVAYDRRREIGIANMGEDFFPNLHARKLFSKVFPVTYNAYFGPSGANSCNTPQWDRRFLEPVAREMQSGNMSGDMVMKLRSLQPSRGALTIHNSVDTMFNEFDLVD